MTNNDAVRTFTAHAAGYEDARRRLIPPFDAFYGTAVCALGLAGRPLRRVLDLGAGTGMLAARVLDAHPGAELVLLDGSEAMLEQARAALGDRVGYAVADLDAALPEGPWDAVVSALAIHHLEDESKRRLFGRIHDALAVDGVFVNAEQVAGPTALFEGAYESWHERRARELGTSDEEWAAAVERRVHDRCATVEHQLCWLRDAGFADADCLFRERRFAVLVARRSA
jgi:tRNA (cmo5U34)-methyltransferase